MGTRGGSITGSGAERKKEAAAEMLRVEALGSTWRDLCSLAATLTTSLLLRVRPLPVSAFISHQIIVIVNCIARARKSKDGEERREGDTA